MRQDRRSGLQYAPRRPVKLYINGEKIDGRYYELYLTQQAVITMEGAGSPKWHYDSFNRNCLQCSEEGVLSFTDNAENDEIYELDIWAERDDYYYETHNIIKIKAIKPIPTIIIPTVEEAQEFVGYQESRKLNFEISVQPQQGTETSSSTNVSTYYLYTYRLKIQCYKATLGYEDYNNSPHYYWVDCSSIRTITFSTREKINEGQITGAPNGFDADTASDATLIDLCNSRWSEYNITAQAGDIEDDSRFLYAVEVTELSKEEQSDYYTTTTTTSITITPTISYSVTSLSVKDYITGYNGNAQGQGRIDMNNDEPYLFGVSPGPVKVTANVTWEPAGKIDDFSQEMILWVGPEYIKILDDGCHLPYTGNAQLPVWHSKSYRKNEQSYISNSSLLLSNRHIWDNGNGTYEPSANDAPIFTTIYDKDNAEQTEFIDSNYNEIKTAVISIAGQYLWRYRWYEAQTAAGVEKTWNISRVAGRTEKYYYDPVIFGEEYQVPQFSYEISYWDRPAAFNDDNYSLYTKDVNNNGDIRYFFRVGTSNEGSYIKGHIADNSNQEEGEVFCYLSFFYDTKYLTYQSGKAHLYCDNAVTNIVFEQSTGITVTEVIANKHYILTPNIIQFNSDLDYCWVAFSFDFYTSAGHNVRRPYCSFCVDKGTISHITSSIRLEKNHSVTLNDLIGTLSYTGNTPTDLSKIITFQNEAEFNNYVERQEETFTYNRGQPAEDLEFTYIITIVDNNNYYKTLSFTNTLSVAAYNTTNSPIPYLGNNINTQYAVDGEIRSVSDTTVNWKQKTISCNNINTQYIQAVYLSNGQLQTSNTTIYNDNHTTSAAPGTYKAYFKNLEGASWSNSIPANSTWIYFCNFSNGQITKAAAGVITDLVCCEYRINAPTIARATLKNTSVNYTGYEIEVEWNTLNTAVTEASDSVRKATDIDSYTAKAKIKDAAWNAGVRWSGSIYQVISVTWNITGRVVYQWKKYRQDIIEQTTGGVAVYSSYDPDLGKDVEDGRVYFYTAAEFSPRYGEKPDAWYWWDEIGKPNPWNSWSHQRGSPPMTSSLSMSPFVVSTTYDTTSTGTYVGIVQSTNKDEYNSGSRSATQEFYYIYDTKQQYTS